MLLIPVHTQQLKISFKFIEGGTLAWTELLTMDETPFESVDELAECVNVMAPWYHDNSAKIQHAQAVVIEYIILL